MLIKLGSEVGLPDSNKYEISDNENGECLYQYDGSVEGCPITILKDGMSPDELYEGLINRMRLYHPSDDVSIIKKAYDISTSAHKEQYRKSGEPYIIHPLYVANILADLRMDKETIVAGLLHDVIEDTVMTATKVEEEFGNDVRVLVEGVTKLQQLRFHDENGEERNPDKVDVQAENLRKMFLAMAKDIRVIIIKLADRLHNMRTLMHMTEEKQKMISRETLDIYAPIAQRLGISRIKVELDDLSLKYLEPQVYYDLVEKVSVTKRVREEYIQSIVSEVSDHMKEANIKADVDGRIKHFFSIYKKMKNQGKTIDQIYDLFAVRILVDTVLDCYAALGIIHQMYKPIPGRFKDYISMPKPNMYQSLHTTLIGDEGRPFEIQVRTFDMHRAAEYGIAAHWKYKEMADGKKASEHEEEKLIWLRQILEWQKDMSDNKEFLNLLKSDLDLFSDSVYCFTPRGEVKNLPIGSTPIDFAYNIHSAVGNKMIGARVNGKLVTIDYSISNGDRIEILTSQNSKGPSRDWLNLVKSTQAKNKINQWFKAAYKEENIEKGKELIASYAKVKGMDQAKLIQPKYTQKIMNKYGFKDWDAVLAAVGHGGLKEGHILNKMQEEYDKDNKINNKILSNEEILKNLNKVPFSNETKTKFGSGAMINGVDDLAIRYSKCCTPVPGDEIVGYVTKGRGITIHRTDCVNVINFSESDRDREIEAEWMTPKEGAEVEKYPAAIAVYFSDRASLMSDIIKVIAEKGINIISVHTDIRSKSSNVLTLCVEVFNREELNKIIDKINSIRNVIEVQRI